MNIIFTNIIIHKLVIQTGSSRPVCCYLVQAQSVEEIHGDVGLRQVDYQPGAHVE